MSGLTADQVLSEIRRIIMPITDEAIDGLKRSLLDRESEIVAANEATEHKAALVHLRDREVFDLRRDLKIANEMNDRLRADLRLANDKRVVFIGGTAQEEIDSLRARCEALAANNEGLWKNLENAREELVRLERISQERADLLEEARKGYDSLKSALHHPYRGKDER